MELLTLDIGGSTIKYGIVDSKGNISNKGKFKTPSDSKESLYNTIKIIWNEYGSNSKGLAISMPGVIDTKKGFAYSGGVLHYIKNCEIAKEISEIINTNVIVANDAKCAGVAELGFGSLKDIDDGVVLVLGTGIGGCIIKDKKLYEGKHFSSAEVSYLLSGATEKESRDKLWVIKNGIEGLADTVEKYYGKHNFTGFDIFELANAGDERILKALKEFSKNVAEGIFTLQAILDVEKFAIGGGISEQPILIKLINEAYDEIHDNFVEEFNSPIYRPKIEVCKFHNDANLLGAYYRFRTIYNIK
ncbi:ROK family protein [Clostridium sp. Sa3CUN1]|uniref:ROK family protein n=1 Tax=Clostridium gallinarum TaxID=2762246 RepID=A0ABR8Q6P8_9CLOT|nr:ROK family protein [Clostridium gallinarum]MBD7916092.1 ROK family protein [Clostridium gallinarum]